MSEADEVAVPLDEKSVEAVDTIDLEDNAQSSSAAAAAAAAATADSAAPEWQPDEGVNECSRCHNKFTMLTRRHHCRACGHIFCGSCTQHRRLMPPTYKIAGLQRTCIGCAEKNTLWPLQSNTVDTPKGRVQYVSLGSGERVVVVLHGTSGTCDQGVLLARMLWQNESGEVEPSEAEGGAAGEHGGDGGISCGPFRVLAVSRPGYGETPLESGPTFEEQVELVHALLEKLSISGRVALVGYGAGAPVAIHFAAAYPDRTCALALLAPISKEYWPGQAKDVPKEKAGVGLVTSLFTSTFQGVSKWAAGSAPDSALTYLFASTSKWEEDMQFIRAYDVQRDPIKQWFFHAYVVSVMVDAASKAGVDNDHTQLAAIEQLPFERVEASTLVVHGKDDGVVDVSHGQHAGEQIRGARLDVRELTEHTVFLGKGGTELQAELRAFLLE